MDFGIGYVLNMFRKFSEQDEQELEAQIKNDAGSIAPPKNNDGAHEIETDIGSRGFSTINQQFYSGHDPKIQNKEQLINTYRGIMSYPEVENAVSGIINDAIVNEQGKDIITLDLDATDFSDNIKERIIKELSVVMSTLDFKNRGGRLFRDWYVDSRIYFHKIMNKDESKGIYELRQLDPRCMELIRESVVETVEGGIKVFRGYKEYFVYRAPKSGYAYAGQQYNYKEEIKIPRSAIVYAHSGLEDCDNNIIGYLHRAVKPANQLRLLEDAMVIYRITRAPERRVFYIDVGMMGGPKATQYVNNIAQGLKNRVVYDARTGTVKNQQNNLSMTEDYWLMRRDGKAVTEVSTLPGGANFSDMDDVKWFNRKLYEALRIPLSRMPKDDGMQIGGDDSISRDEMDFSQFIRDLQIEFTPVISDPLKTNLVAKKVITEEEWDENVSRISFIYQQDSYYAEVKDIEILERRLNLMTNLQGVVGTYVSHKYIMKNILRMSDEEIDEEAKQIEEESTQERFKNPDIEENF